MKPNSGQSQARLQPVPKSLGSNGNFEKKESPAGRRMCRIMCSPFLEADHTTSSSPHQVSWSQFEAKKAPQEPFVDALIGGVAFAMLLIAAAFV